MDKLQYYMLGKGAGGSSVSVEELEVTSNGTYQAPEGVAYSPVVVDVDADNVPETGVNFFGYDNEFLGNWTVEETATKTELPELPVYTNGLIATGWNWTLEGIKDYVASYGTCDVQTELAPEDNKIHIFVSMREEFLSPYLTICVNGTAKIDWGDESEPSIITGTNDTNPLRIQHNYDSSGDYEIKIELTSTGSSDGIGIYRGFYTSSGDCGSTLFLGHAGNPTLADKIYQNAIKSIWISKICTRTYLGGNFAYLECLENIIIANGAHVFYISGDSGGLCYYNYSLKFISIPKTSTFISEKSFRGAFNLKRIILPMNMTKLSGGSSEAESPFYMCYKLKRLILPPQLTSSLPQYFINNCPIDNMIIPNISASIASVFYDNDHILNVKCFKNLFGINFLKNAKRVRFFIIPNGTTTISNSMFSGSGLQEIDLPSSITTINNFAFNNCYSLVRIRFHSIEPPQVSSINAFQNLPPTCKIYVPQESLESYKSATNYPDPTVYEYIGY